MNERVDRIVYAHDRSFDFVPVASSLPDSGLDTWNEVLRGHALVFHERRPATSMWYWNDGEDAAVLWRIRAAGAARADRCHALVGPVRVLDTAMALALNGWKRWESEEWTPVDGAPLPPVTSLREEYERLNGESNRSVEGDLLPLVRAVLMNPEQPVSIVTDAVEGSSKVKLLRDLLNVVGAMFGPTDRWTFSTFETRHDEGVRRLPRVAFLPGDHEENGNHPIRRAIVGLPPASLLANDFYLRTAEMLVGHYLRGGSRQLTAWLAGLGVLDVDKPRDRLERLRDALGATSPKRRVVVQPLALPPPTDVELVKQLGTVPRGSLGEVLAEVRRRKVAGRAERATVLRLVLANSTWVERVCASVEPEEADDAVDTLLGFAFEPADWRDEQVVEEINRAVADLATTPWLEKALARSAVAHQAWESLTTGLAIRHLRQLGLDVRFPEIPPASASSIKDRVLRRITGAW